MLYQAGIVVRSHYSGTPLPWEPGKVLYREVSSFQE